MSSNDIYMQEHHDIAEDGYGHLPDGWSAYWDQRYQRHYFVDPTGASTWYDPRKPHESSKTKTKSKKSQRRGGGKDGASPVPSFEVFDESPGASSMNVGSGSPGRSSRSSTPTPTHAPKSSSSPKPTGSKQSQKSRSSIVKALPQVPTPPTDNYNYSYYNYNYSYNNNNASTSDPFFVSMPAFTEDPYMPSQYYALDPQPGYAAGLPPIIPPKPVELRNPQQDDNVLDEDIYDHHLSSPVTSGPSNNTNINNGANAGGAAFFDQRRNSDAPLLPENMHNNADGAGSRRPSDRSDTSVTPLMHHQHNSDSAMGSGYRPSRTKPNSTSSNNNQATTTTITSPQRGGGYIPSSSSTRIGGPPHGSTSSGLFIAGNPKYTKQRRYCCGCFRSRSGCRRFFTIFTLLILTGLGLLVFFLFPRQPRIEISDTKALPGVATVQSYGNLRNATSADPYQIVLNLGVDFSVLSGNYVDIYVQRLRLVGDLMDSENGNVLKPASSSSTPSSSSSSNGGNGERGDSMVIGTLENLNFPSNKNVTLTLPVSLRYAITTAVGSGGLTSLEALVARDVVLKTIVDSCGILDPSKARDLWVVSVNLKGFPTPPPQTICILSFSFKFVKY
jgi:hypothetical protein